MAIARLPQPGSDEGQWGDLLNNFLLQSHKGDGALKDGIVKSNNLANNAITVSSIGAQGGTDGQVLVKDSQVSSGISWRTPSASGTLPEASPTVTGIVRLAGDLSGTSTAPTVPALNTKADKTTTYTKTEVDDAINLKADITALSSYITTSQKGAENGVASLDSAGKVPSSQLPVIPAAQVSSDWDATTGIAQILNKPTLSTVATTGSYTSLTDKPTIPTNLDSLSDVSVSNPSTGQVLKYNGTAWAPASDDVSGGTGGANLTSVVTADDITINSDSGTDVTLAGATTDDAGLMTSADKTKLNSIAASATANSTDTQLRDRSTHTGTQAISTVDGLQAAIDGKASSVHTHAIADTTGLQTALDGKASTAHTHTIANVTNLQTSLDGKASAAGGGLESVATVNASTNSTDLNLANGNVFDVTLSSSTTFSFSGAVNNKACSFTLYLKQDVTGGRVVSWPTNKIKWSGGAPTLTTTAGAIDIMVFETIDGGGVWYGSLVGTNFVF